jgi:hypothetical protein
MFSKRQQEEIDFLCTHFGGKPEDARDYISATVHGHRTTSDKLSGNSLRIAKTKLDRNVKMWREGLEEGLLAPWELEEDFGGTAFGQRLIASVVTSTFWNDPLAPAVFVLKNHPSLRVL